jgi:hypothetical protein
VASNTWTTGAPMLTPRFNAMAGVVSGQIVVFGGRIPAGFNPNGNLNNYSDADVTEIYDPLADSWTIGPRMVSSSSGGGQGMTFNDTQIFAIPGYFGNVQMLGSGTYSQPSISSITVTSGQSGSTVSAVINGTNLSGATSVEFTGSGVTAIVQPGGTATSVPVTISIFPAAATGQRQLSVNTPTGSSWNFTGFSVDSGKKKTGQITSY